MADKGLESDVVGLFGGTMLGISSVAPAYALTATLGILAASVGAKTPVVIIAGFLPMFFAAYAYREFNKVMPDSGTSFTWTSKAFGPYIGWLGGWAAVLATIIVLSNLAGVAVQFLYQFIGSAVNSEMGLILIGLVVMAILRVRQPAFFRGETIVHESAHAMRPYEHLVS